MKNSLVRSWAVAGVLMAGLAGCAGTGDKSGAYVDDSWITSKVKSEMIVDKSVKGSDINVKTNRGVVTLSGTVATSNESNKAVEIAQGIKGVKSVENDIRIQ